jgi:ubiquinol-cytochrome c reductase iron-sulfur subunit
MTKLRDWVVSAAVLLVGRSGGPASADGDRDGRIVARGEPDRRAESWVLALLALATFAAAAFVVVYALDPVSHRTQLLGLTLGVALASIAAALVVTGGHLVVTEELPEPYPRPNPDDADDVTRIVAESASRITRRRLLTLGGAAAGGTLGLALLAPALSLGPLLDTESLVATPWRRGRRLVDSGGSPLRAADVEEGAFYTAFPEGAPEERLGAPVVVVRLTAGELDLPAGRRGWAPGGIVAYSKICTHAGCAVALYRKPTFPAAEPKPALVCPCHYSTFDPATGGTVIFGPAGRALPQLPLEVDRAGNLRAAGPFSGRIGPAWWGVRE